MSLGYISRRLFQLALILFGVSVLVFLMLRMVPGDPAQLLLGEYANPEELTALRHQLGLDRSYAVQYGIYIKNILQGDFGNSVRTGAPVIDEIFPRLMATVELSVWAMLIAILFGISAGVISAVRSHSVLDYISMFLALIGVSMPIFWLGLMLIYLLSVKFPVLPMMAIEGTPLTLNCELMVLPRSITSSPWKPEALNFSLIAPSSPPLD